MPTDPITSLDLPPQARELLWRIFGNGTSPVTLKSPYDLIEPVINKRASLPASEKTACIARIRGWFQAHGDSRWLASDLAKPVAQAIIDGVRDDLSRTAIWAIGSIDFEVSQPLIRAHWSHDHIRRFCAAAVAAIQHATTRERIIDPRRAGPYRDLDPAKSRVPRQAIERASPLRTFHHLETHGWELLHYALHRTVANLIELLVALEPERFEALVPTLDHPVLQALAAECFTLAVVPTDHRAPLAWIKPGASEPLVALGVYHTLATINTLDSDRGRDPADYSHPSSRTELKPGRDDPDAAPRELLHALVDSLSALPAATSARWLGELLTAAPDILHGNQHGTKPKRVAELEAHCMQRLSSCLTSDHDDILGPLRAGLRLTPRNTWNTHVADLAWTQRTDAPDSARELADAALDCHIRQVRSELANNSFYLHWDVWHDRDWIDAIGRALLLSNPGQSPTHYTDWVRARCLELPLSGWDSEDRLANFFTADRIAHHWFLVAIHAARHACELGQPPDPTDIRALAELTWSHGHFAKQRGCLDADVSVAGEAAARLVIDVGQVADAWLIHQASSLRSSRALWALADQYRRPNRQGSPLNEQRYADFAGTFAHAASLQFGDPTQYTPVSLYYWALLWLSVRAPDPAVQTATAFVQPTYRKRRSRAEDILVLKLLAMATAGGRFDEDLERLFVQTYGDLWLPHTPTDEQSERAAVDAYLRESGSFLRQSR